MDQHQASVQVRTNLAASLRSRQSELLETALTRVQAVSASDHTPDHAYIEGLRAAVESVLEYCFVAIEGSSRRNPPVPLALISQARKAARSGVGLETVMLRASAVNVLLSVWILAETPDDKLASWELRQILRDQAIAYEALVRVIAREHVGELEDLSEAQSDQLSDCVRKLLAAELTDTSKLEYELERWHVGVVALGPQTPKTLLSLARHLDLRLLSVGGDRGDTWAWLGSTRPIDSGGLARFARSKLPERASLFMGEPGYGPVGWRLTHQQALAILHLGQQSGGGVIRYADCGLLASLAENDVLVRSLRQIYLTPLEQERDGGRCLRRTLRAYFEAKGQVASTAASLKVSRKTVSNRLAKVENYLGCSVASCSFQLKAALDIEAVFCGAGGI